MMTGILKRGVIALFLVLFAANFSACSTADKNLAARERLEKCRYELDRIAFVGLQRKGFAIRAIECDVFLRITNTTDGEVILDRIAGTFSLDKKGAGSFEHRRTVRIAKGASAVEKIRVRIPLAKAVRAVSALPKNITVNADVFVSLVIGSRIIGTPYVAKVSRTFAIPYP